MSGFHRFYFWEKILLPSISFGAFGPDISFANFSVGHAALDISFGEGQVAQNT